MLDQAGGIADLDLLLAPGDSAECLGTAMWMRRDGRRELSQLWVALHRRHGVWTHGYRVVRGDRPGRLLVWLECAVEGDAREAVRARLEGAMRG